MTVAGAQGSLVPAEARLTGRGPAAGVCPAIRARLNGRRAAAQAAARLLGQAVRLAWARLAPH